MMEGVNSGVPQRKRPAGSAWWRTWWFYLSSQAALGVLLIPLFRAFVFPNIPYLPMLLAALSLPLLPLALFPRLSTNLDIRTIALNDRERNVRKDLIGNKALLVSLGEILMSFLPHYLETARLINFFERRKEHTFADLQLDRDETGRRIKLALSFLRGGTARHRPVPL